MSLHRAKNEDEGEGRTWSCSCSPSSSGSPVWRIERVRLLWSGRRGICGTFGTRTTSCRLMEEEEYFPTANHRRRDALLSLCFLLPFSSLLPPPPPPLRSLDVLRAYSFQQGSHTRSSTDPEPLSSWDSSRLCFKLTELPASVLLQRRSGYLSRSI